MLVEIRHNSRSSIPKQWAGIGQRLIAQVDAGWLGAGYGVNYLELHKGPQCVGGGCLYNNTIPHVHYAKTPVVPGHCLQD